MRKHVAFSFRDLSHHRNERRALSRRNRAMETFMALSKIFQRYEALKVQMKSS